MENIDDFNLGCALILARLYEAFPVACVLKVAELDDGADLLPEERTERLARRRRVFTATVQFLAEEGYLTVGSAAGLPECGAFGQARLTAKGLAQLSKTPEAIRPPGKTLGERLIELAREGARQSALEALRALIAESLG